MYFVSVISELVRTSFAFLVLKSFRSLCWYEIVLSAVNISLAFSVRVSFPVSSHRYDLPTDVDTVEHTNAGRCRSVSLCLSFFPTLVTELVVPAPFFNIRNIIAPHCRRLQHRLQTTSQDPMQHPQLPLYSCCPGSFEIRKPNTRPRTLLGSTRDAANIIDSKRARPRDD